MKPILYALLGLLATPFAWGQTGPRNAPSGTRKQNECSIGGMVVKLVGSEPLKSASVQLLNMDDHSRGASTGTDAGGRFELKGIDPGRYRLKVARTGFVTQVYGQKTPNDPFSMVNRIDRNSVQYEPPDCTEVASIRRIDEQISGTR